MFYCAKIIEYGLYLLVFLLPLQTRWIIRAGEINGGYSEYGTISLYGTDILLIILLLLFIISCFKSRKSEIRDVEKTKKQKNKKTNFQIFNYWWLIAGLELMIFISIFVAPDKLVAGYRYGVFLLGVGLFWLIVSASYNRLKLLYAFLAGVVLQAGLGIWQFLTQSNFACKWLGLAAHNPSDLGVSVVETLSGGRWLRAYGGLDHPNVLGGLLVLGVLLVIGLMVTRKQKNKKTKKQENKKINLQNLILLTSYFLLLTSLFFTFSRGAWAGLIVGLLTLLGVAVLKKDLWAQKKILKIILAGGILIFILFSMYGDLVLTRLSKDTRLEVKSNTERVESYQRAWEVIKDNWLLGVGIGNYGIMNYESRIKNNMSDMPSWYYQPVHNVFLLVWAEIGIIGFFCFFAFLLFCFFVIIKKKYSHQGTKIAILTAMCVMFLVDHWWWSLHFGVLMFWFLAGICLLSGVEKYEKKIKTRKFNCG